MFPGFARRPSDGGPLNTVGAVTQLGWCPGPRPPPLSAVSTFSKSGAKFDISGGVQPEMRAPFLQNKSTAFHKYTAKNAQQLKRDVGNVPVANTFTEARYRGLPTDITLNRKT